MSLNLTIKNISGAALPIDDLGTEFAIDEIQPWSAFGLEELSTSEDLIVAIVEGKIEITESLHDTTFDVPLAIRTVATGGAGSIVNDDGLLRTHASPRPLNTTTYFTGAGDLYTGGSWQRGKGAKMLFQIKSDEASKTVDIIFAEDIWIKDGFMIVEGAPFGASLDIEIVAPAGAVAPAAYGEIVVNRYGNKIPLLKNGWFPMDAQDGGKVPFGMIVRLTVNNSDGQNDEEPAATFKVAGRIEMFRSQTIDPLGG